MPFLHLPVQSGSDRILEAMNRRHTADDYRRTVDRLREARPDLALSSDFIVGFPGESEVDFGATLDLVDEIGFAQAYSFKYTPRPGTPAATRRPGARTGQGRAARRRCRRYCASSSSAFNDAAVGATLPVLFEKPGRHAGQLVGRSPWLQSVHADAAPDRIGAIVPVRIIGVRSNSLAGGRRTACEAGAMSAVSPDRVGNAPGARARSNSTTICCCRCSTASATRISTASSASSASRWCRAATGWRSPARLGDRDRPLALSRLYERLKRGHDDRYRRGRRRAALRPGRARRQEPQPVARGRQLPHPQAPHRRAHRGPGALRPGDARERAGLRPRSRRHRQDLSRGRHRRSIC